VSPRNLTTLANRTVTKRRLGALLGHMGDDVTMASIEPELWVERAARAVTFYERALGADTLHRVGEGEDIVAQLQVGEARFWIASANSELRRFSPNDIGGRTSRTLLIVDDPDAAIGRAVSAGATEVAPVGDEHGWRIGRIIDPYGHEWEIGRPLGDWPPNG
jgi:PhnB protein